MTKEEILLGNKLIAEFMADYDLKRNWSKVPLLYNSSWDWLMPVVEKIKGMEKEYPIAIDSVTNIFIWYKINFVWIAVVEFIKWYNNNYK